MIEQASTGDLPAMGRRLKAGIGVFVISIFLPIADIPLIAVLGLLGKMATYLSGVLLIGAALLEVTAVAVMGKPGYVYIKNRFLSFFKQYGPAKEVSRTRYNIGLVMFCVPIVFGAVSILCRLNPRPHRKLNPVRCDR